MKGASTALGSECFLQSWGKPKSINFDPTDMDRGQAYFKNSEMREMDDHFGDLYGIISDREIEISHELAQFVLEYEELLTTASDICGELDRYNKL